MIHLQSLGQAEAECAIQAVVRAAERTMAVAVSDVHGDLIACLRMDGAPTRVLEHAIRKAYTAAKMGRDTLRFKADLSERGGNLGEWGDPRLTTLQGGVVVKLDGQVAGGIGVGGNTLERDTEVAQAALEAIKPLALGQS
jgi:uncharacterized protein GlcG (DUF336 family)